jgi:hypothetical protein
MPQGSNLKKYGPETDARIAELGKTMNQSEISRALNIPFETIAKHIKENGIAVQRYYLNQRPRIYISSLVESYSFPLSKLKKKITELQAKQRNLCNHGVLYGDRERAYDRRAVQIFDIEGRVIAIQNLLTNLEVIKRHCEGLDLTRHKKALLKNAMVERLLKQFEAEQKQEVSV